MDTFDEKTRAVKSRATVPLNRARSNSVHVLWGKLATKVGNLRIVRANLVLTLPHGPQIVKL